MELYLGHRCGTNHSRIKSRKQAATAPKRPKIYRYIPGFYPFARPQIVRIYNCRSGRESEVRVHCCPTMYSFDRQYPGWQSVVKMKS